MSTTSKRLEQIMPRLQSENFIQNKGLGNEIGFYIFDYDPADELVVRDYVQHIKKEFNYPGSNRRIIEHDLYEILLDIAKDKGVLDQIPLQEKKDKDKLFKAMVQLATPQAYIDRIAGNYEPGDIIFITGVGKVYPIMRSTQRIE